MRIITWNLAGRKKTLSNQIEYLISNKPHLVCLQEVTIGTVKPLISKLREAGYNYTAHTISESHTKQGPRKYGLLIASKSAVKPIEMADVPWPERILAVQAQYDSNTFTVLTTHIPPGSSNGWKKVEMLQSVAEHSTKMPMPQVVCGDFNCPKEELPDGTVITWAQRTWKDGSIHVARGYTKWDAAEREIIEKFPHKGLLDVPRSLHGNEARMYSYFDIRKGKITASRRYDHLFASEQLSPIRAQYDDTPRAAGLSDHAPLIVDFKFL